MAQDDIKDITQRISRDTLKEVKKIPVLCPWCNNVFTLADYQVEQGKKTEVTHKICPKCLKKVKGSDESK
ncbi:MAG TPA: hypothetical protein DCZ94_13305 [Lentisphaeria bacterium]|nr:MAG: hypothetical protein A2X48_15365 [Lentisphaerae bacterium GWF2_49_21]HBC87925.1 hypothetical protein [Lentisphaeria bacterium]